MAVADRGPHAGSRDIGSSVVSARSVPHRIGTPQTAAYGVRPCVIGLRNHRTGPYPYASRPQLRARSDFESRAISSRLDGTTSLRRVDMTFSRSLFESGVGRRCVRMCLQFPSPPNPTAAWRSSRSSLPILRRSSLLLKNSRRRRQRKPGQPNLRLRRGRAGAAGDTAGQARPAQSGQTGSGQTTSGIAPRECGRSRARRRLAEGSRQAG